MLTTVSKMFEETALDNLYRHVVVKTVSLEEREYDGELEIIALSSSCRELKTLIRNVHRVEKLSCQLYAESEEIGHDISSIFALHFSKLKTRI